MDDDDDDDDDDVGLNIFFFCVCQDRYPGFCPPFKHPYGTSVSILYELGVGVGVGPGLWVTLFGLFRIKGNDEEDMDNGVR